MLPKIHRLSKKTDFDTVFKTGQSTKNGFLIVKVLKNNLDKSRFGFVVSKKISTKATIRNKVKRRLREAVTGAYKDFNKPLDIIIITLPGIEKKEFADLQKMVLGAFQKLTLN